jgi:hypothetical protein
MLVRNADRNKIEYELFTLILEKKTLRRKIQQSQRPDPDRDHQYRKEKFELEKRLEKSETIKEIIDRISQVMRFKKIEHTHWPKKMEFGFFGKGGYEYFKYNPAGWVRFGTNLDRDYSVEFMPYSAEDLIEKMIRFRIIERL